MCCCIAAAAASGQGLVKEVEGIRDFDPDKRPATRLTSTPQLLAPQIEATRLRFSGNPVVVQAENTLTPMPVIPASLPAPAASRSGYAAIGYFPKGDIDVSAGYRLLDKTATQLDVWGQLNRKSYKESAAAGEEKMRLATTDATAGINFAWSGNSGNLLNISASYTYNHFNYPEEMMIPRTLSVSRGHLNAAWDGRAGSRVRYGVSGSVLYMGYSDAAYPAQYTMVEERVCPLNELSGGIKAYCDYRISRKVNLSLEAEYEGADLSRQYLIFPGTTDINRAAGISKGVVSLTPKVWLTGRKMNGYIGANVAVATGDASGTKAGFTGGWNLNLSPYFSLNAQMHSGPVLNTLEQLYNVNRYAAPLGGTGVSYIPCDFELTVNVMSFRGFTLKAGGGLAAANDWVLPGVLNGVPTLTTTDLFALRYIIGAGYRYGTTIEVAATLEGCTSDDYDKGYYRWIDRAGTVARVNVNYRPVEAVTLTAGYEYRGGRKSVALDIIDKGAGTPMAMEMSLTPLGAVSNLYAGVYWAINGNVGVFGRVEGITQGRYLLPSCLPGQRLKPLAGVTLKF